MAYAKKRPEDGTHWRDSRDYRAIYFQTNPGFLGKIYTCSQCGRPLWGKSQVQVDHIFPPSQFAERYTDKHGVKHNTSLLAEAMNNEFNTVAICPHCNRQKSDKVGLMTGKGYAAKVVEKLLFTVQETLLLGAWAVKFTLVKTVFRPFIPHNKRGKKVPKPKLGEGFWATMLALVAFMTMCLIYYPIRWAVKAVTGTLKGVGKGTWSAVTSKTPIGIKLVLFAVVVGFLYYLWYTLLG